MVQHRFLGEVDRHEPTGISNATSGQVYAADGNGGGAWTTLASPIPSAIWRYQTAYDAADVTLTEAAWTKLALTTEYRNVISGASLSSGVITLPAGTYYANWKFQYTTTDGRFIVLSRLRDTTNSVNLNADASFQGSTNDLTISTSLRSHIWNEGTAVFTLSGSADVELQYYCNSSSGNPRFENFSILSGIDNIHAEMDLFVQAT